jgi:hypothetical protein
MEATLAGEPLTGLTPAPTVTINAPLTLPASVQLQPSFDVIELLPVGTPQDRLRLLRQHSRDLHAITVPHEEVREASMARVAAENALKRLLAPASEGGFKLPEGDSRVLAAERALEKATAAFERLQERQQARAASWQSASAALANVEAWLRDARPSGTVLRDDEGDPPKLNKGESLLDGIERLRRRTRELKADLHRIESAPYPSSHAKAKMRAQVEALATQGAPSVALLVEHDGEVEFQTQRLQSEVFGSTERSLAFAQVPDTLALTCWLHRDALIAALDREIAAESDDKAALSHTDRELRTSEVMGDLLAVERTEAALVWRAMSEKLPVEFRADINPQALLGIALVTAPRAIDGPTTSPLAFDIVQP